MMKLEDKLDATAAGGGHAAARALAAGGGASRHARGRRSRAHRVRSAGRTYA